MCFSSGSPPFVPDAAGDCCPYGRIILPLLELSINGIAHTYSFESGFFTQNVFEIHPYFECVSNLSLSNNPLSECITNLFIFLSVCGHLGCFWFWLLGMGFHGHWHKCFCGCVFSFLSGKCQGVKFLGRRVHMCLTLQTTTKWFFKVFVTFYISMSNVWDFWLLHILANI